FVKCGKLLIPSAEMSTRLGNFSVINKITDYRRQCSGSKQFFGGSVPFNKCPFHSKAKNRRKKSSLFFRSMTRVILSKLFFFLIGNSSILYQDLVDFLYCHCAVTH